MAIKEKHFTYYYQVFSPRIRMPITLPTENQEEALTQLENLVKDDGWKLKSLVIVSFRRHNTIPLRFRTGRTYFKIKTILSPDVRKRLRKLRRKLIKEEMVGDPQQQLNFLVNFIMGCKKFEISQEGFSQEFERTLSFLRKKGYPQQKIDQMMRKASNSYRFGFEVARLNRKIIMPKPKQEDTNEARDNSTEQKE